MKQSHASPLIHSDSNSNRVDGSCAKHLTADSYTVVMLLTFILTILLKFHHPLTRFYSRLKTFLFCKSFPPQPSFSSSGLTTWIPPYCLLLLLSVSAFTTTTFAKNAFRCSAPAVWNSLPQTVLSSDSVAVFKLKLKTFLFSQAFSPFSAH